jgi:hypothetical protein
MPRISWRSTINLKILNMYSEGGGIKVHSTLRPTMAYCASPGWLWWWRNRWNDWQWKPKYSEKTAPVPLCPPQIPRAARTRTRAAAEGSQRLTAWATARPRQLTYLIVRHLPAEDTVGILYLATASENIEFLACTVVRSRVCEIVTVL